jgi:CRP-like cAMP-binding protein
MLAKPTKYLLTTETVADSSALVWSRSTILSLSRKYIKLLENELNIASDYVEDYRNFYVAATYDTAAQRAVRVLNSLARGIGSKSADGIEIKVSNEDLANEAALTVFTVSRLLSDWQRKGLLMKKRGRVVVPSLEDLVRNVG